MTYQANGLDYTKTFVLKRGSYAIDVEYDVINNSGNNATFGMYAHLRQNVMDDGGSLTMPTYRGGAYLRKIRVTKIQSTTCKIATCLLT